MEPELDGNALLHFTNELLDRWEAGELDELQVLNEAERQLEMSGYPQFEQHDSRSVAIDVLRNLEILFSQWITRDDIPAMRTFLAVGAQNPVAAWEGWGAYWDMVDWNQRKESLRRDRRYFGKLTETPGEQAAL